MVPPAPAEFSEEEPRAFRGALERTLERRDGPLQAGVEAGAQVRADVYDNVRVDRASDVEGRPECSLTSQRALATRD